QVRTAGVDGGDERQAGGLLDEDQPRVALDRRAIGGGDGIGDVELSRQQTLQLDGRIGYEADHHFCQLRRTLVVIAVGSQGDGVVAQPRLEHEWTRAYRGVTEIMALRQLLGGEDGAPT